MPPAGAALPLPRRLSCMPSSTPAGMSISTTVSSQRAMFVRVLRLGLDARPGPPQAGQVDAVCIWPRMLVTRRTDVPPHWRQVVFHALGLDQANLFLVTPSAISSRVSWTLMRRLDPFIDPGRLRHRRRPPAPPKMSPNWLKMSSMFMPAPPPAAPHARMTEPVVLGPLLLVAEDLIGLGPP